MMPLPITPIVCGLCQWMLCNKFTVPAKIALCAVGRLAKVRKVGQEEAWAGTRRQ